MKTRLFSHVSLFVVALLACACAASTLDKVRSDIALAREIVDTVDNVAQKQCPASASAGLDGGISPVVMVKMKVLP